MTTITILPENSVGYRAVAGDKNSTGRTVGEALDLLTSMLSDDENGTLVIIQNRKADHFFSAAEQKRLTELMQKRVDCNQQLSVEEAKELENLIAEELRGAGQRAAALLNQMSP